MAHNKKYLNEKNFTPFINDFAYIFSLLPFDFDPEMLLNMGNCYFKNLIYDLFCKYTISDLSIVQNKTFNVSCTQV